MIQIKLSFKTQRAQQLPWNALGLFTEYSFQMASSDFYSFFAFKMYFQPVENQSPYFFQSAASYTCEPH